MSGAHWEHLYAEVVESGLCTGCSACIVACPHDVLGYSEAFLPIQEGGGMAPNQCVHGDHGCDVCTRACPRFRTWEGDFDQTLFGRKRQGSEPYGIARTVISVWAKDGSIHEHGQDGGFVTAALLWGLENGEFEAAALSKPSDDRPFDSVPTLATTPEDILECAGSVYTYSANPLALSEANEQGIGSVALVGMGCQASINGSVRSRGLGRWSSRISLTIGLFCSKTFTYEGQKDVLHRHKIRIEDVIKVDVKGRFIVWTRDGGRTEIPLDELYPHTRTGCRLCPDFSAEHADISAGGIGEDGWTLVVVRTKRGEDFIKGMVSDGSLIARPGQDDPQGMKLLSLLSKKSRRRWPTEALPHDQRAPGMLPGNHDG